MHCNLQGRKKKAWGQCCPILKKERKKKSKLQVWTVKCLTGAPSVWIDLHPVALRGSHVSEVNPSALISQTWALPVTCWLIGLTVNLGRWTDSPPPHSFTPPASRGEKMVTLGDENLHLNFYLRLKLQESKCLPTSDTLKAQKTNVLPPPQKSLGNRRSSRWLSRIMERSLTFTRVLPQPAAFVLPAAAARRLVCF